MPKKFRSKSHKRKKMIRDFLQSVRDNLSNHEKVKAILKSHHPNYRKYLFPKVIEECIHLDNFDSLRELIQAYINDVDYDAPLIHLAVKHKHEKLTQLLLDNYFDPNITDPQKQISCLMIAAKDNNIPIVKMLLDQDKVINNQTSNVVNDVCSSVDSSSHSRLFLLLNISFVFGFVFMTCESKE